MEDPEGSEIEGSEPGSEPGSEDGSPEPSDDEDGPDPEEDSEPDFDEDGKRSRLTPVLCLVCSLLSRSVYCLVMS